MPDWRIGWTTPAGDRSGQERPVDRSEWSRPAPARDAPVPAYSWYALGVLVLVYILNFIDRQILSILANDIKADLKVDDAFLGFLYGTAFAIFYALFGIPLGKLADSWKRVRLMTHRAVAVVADDRGFRPGAKRRDADRRAHWRRAWAKRPPARRPIR